MTAVARSNSVPAAARHSSAWRQTSTDTDSTGQRDRRLGLRRLDPHLHGGVVGEQAVGDGRAQALERLVAALLGDERDALADRAVVDRVLDEVGHGRVALADLEAQVEDEPLADLALGRAHAVVGVERQPA